MTHDDTHDRIVRARNAAVLSKVGSLAGAIGVVLVALGVVGLLTGRTALGVIAVVVAVVLFAVTAIGTRVNAQARQDPGVQQRSSRLRRARYRSAYPQHQQQQQNQRADTDDRPVE
ncbi:hypothetical protein [Williamsia sp.]|uniref:hypothetical protein n=1 Tax=Williamsia sp. TaxID=1872085 RepID=UPI001A3425D7|nr:hypothetical protein [Williamsia sp.]MBJ7291889.1 hypothetical protein [Williamsia sp.]